MPDKEPRLASVMLGLLRRNAGLRLFLERRIVPKLQEPRFVLIENASYMGRGGLLTRTLHEAGLVVAEAQHGLISRQHYVYNYSPACLNDLQHPSRLYLPDILFTFGDYWSEQAQMPVEKISIGSPHLTRVVHNLRSVQVIADQILVLSGDARALELTQELARAFPQRRIVFKLHPIESHLTASYSAQLPFQNVTVADFANVYELIAASAIIIGHSSTALIEAVAFPGKRIFYHDAEFIPPDVGDQFTEAADLIALIENPSRGFPSARAEKFWTFDYEERLAQFARLRLSARA
jgi:hypothetical protein